MASVQTFTDEELISSLKTAALRNNAIRGMYKQYFDVLSGYIINNNGSEEDAEDIFQEVIVNFIALVEQNKFRGESSVKTFLYSMNRFAWLNELKRRGRANVRENIYEKGRDLVIDDAAKPVIQKEASLELQQIMDSLGEICKKILMMFYYGEAGIKEIMQETNYESEQAVRNKKSKCMKQLATMIEENADLKNSLKNLLHV